MNEGPTLLPACDYEEGSAQRQAENREWERSREMKPTNEKCNDLIGSRSVVGSAIGRVCTHMIGEVQTLERIAETSDALESWLGKNAGTNDDWPIEIKADEYGAAKLSSLLRDLNDSLIQYRLERLQSANNQSNDIMRAYREGFLGALSGEPSEHNIGEAYSDEWLDGWTAGANVLSE